MSSGSLQKQNNRSPVAPQRLTKVIADQSSFQHTHGLYIYKDDEFTMKAANNTFLLFAAF